MDCPLTYTLIVSNPGNEPADNVTLTDTFPTTFSVQNTNPAPTSQVGNTYTWNFGTLLPGATTTVTVVGLPTQTGTLTNTAVTSTTSIDANPANNSATASTSVQPDCNHSLKGRSGGQFFSESQIVRIANGIGSHCELNRCGKTRRS